MPIIISNEEGTRKIEESAFKAESKLQEYIYNNPEVLPIEEIDDDIPFVIVAREVPTSSGPIDALGLDANGNIYVIETKLYKNSDKRTVLAQVLDYGAALWKHTNEFSKFMMLLREKYRNKFDEELDDKIVSYLEVEEENLEEYLDQVKQNLDKGEFRFVVLMDQVESRLKDLILFMNHNSAFDIYAVELDYYKFDGYHLSIPKLYGAEVKKSVSRTTSGRRKWDEESFFEDLKNKVDESDYTKVKKIFEGTKSLGTIVYGTGVDNGSITLRAKSKDGRLVSIFNYFSNGIVYLFSGYPVPRDQRDELKESFASHLKEQNPNLPSIYTHNWKGNISDIGEDQIDDFIQFYRDVVKEIRGMEL